MLCSAVSAVLAMLGAACLLFAAIPMLLYGIFNIGAVALLLLGMLCLTELWLLQRCGRPRRPWEVFSGRGSVERMMRNALGVVLGFSMVTICLLSAAMLRFGFYNLPAVGRTDTAVVLGAGLKNDQPSRMLTYRLEGALRYLADNPQAMVVVTGGVGTNSLRSEAEAGAQWLTERGIAPERILLEDNSRDTEQNLRNTVELLTANSLPHEVVVFTDGFHQWRGQLYARLAIAAAQGQPRPAAFWGAQVSGVPCRTPWGLLPCYWLREQAALAEAFLFTDIGRMYLG